MYTAYTGKRTRPTHTTRATHTESLSRVRDQPVTPPHRHIQPGLLALTTAHTHTHTPQPQPHSTRWQNRPCELRPSSCGFMAVPIAYELHGYNLHRNYCLLYIQHCLVSQQVCLQVCCWPTNTKSKAKVGIPNNQKRVNMPKYRAGRALPTADAPGPPQRRRWL